MAYDTNKLFAQLQNTGLQNRDQPLYQLIYLLIQALASAQGDLTRFSSLTQNISTASITNIYQQIIQGNRESSGNSRVIPGPAGAKGDTGATGATLPGPLGVIKHYTESYPRYVPMMGNQGNQGTTGSQGPMGPVIAPRVIEISKRIIQINQLSGSSGSGKLAQIQKTTSGEVVTSSVVIPFDNSIPQSGEGVEVFTVTITAQDAASLFVIDVEIFATVTATPWIIIALFKDSDADAIATVATFNNLSTAGATIPLRHFIIAGSTSPQTFKVRIGPSSAATVTVNGQSGGRIFGGVAASSISVTEILP